jgi:MFS family permease
MLVCQGVMTFSLLVVWTLSDSLAPLVVFVIVNGASGGAVYSIMSPVIAQLFKSSPVQTTLSLAVTGWSLVIIGPSVSGAILDAARDGDPRRGDYLGLIMFCGGMAFVSLALMVAIRYRADHKVWKRL